MITVRERDGEAYVVTLDDVTGTTYTEWCKVLGEPGVDRTKRGEHIALALRIANSLRGTPGMANLTK